ncbi:MAG: hypothetical protein IJT01_11355 [Selenomonadaceae bacterium]|nr:hypothetical protein [Selenomonadaceae bacterium]
MGCYDGPQGLARGVFPLGGAGGKVPVYLPDGTYYNRIDGAPLEVINGSLCCSDQPIIL